MNKMNAAHTLTHLLKEIQKIDQEFPLQYMICLNEISKHNGISLTELSQKTDMPLSTISRIVGALSQKRQKGSAFNLVSVKVCPEERRKKELSLTTKGAEALACIHKILN